jgi:hypothetical protein
MSGGINVVSDPHVVAYYADQGILTVSMPQEVSDGESEWDGTGVNDLYVFRVDTTSATPGLTLIGTIAHDDSVLRSVEVNDRLISISPDTIEVHDFAQPDAVIASLTINTPDSNPLPVEPLPMGLPAEPFSPPLEMPGTIQAQAVPAIQGQAAVLTSAAVFSASSSWATAPSTLDALAATVTATPRAAQVLEDLAQT